ncbi:MAG TPA: beta/gamma crystallin-related protein [Rhizomicrobium sp.]|nr:beta/gamma crystallin-related protein [Rhizomicrobium sp.]
MQISRTFRLVVAAAALSCVAGGVTAAPRPSIILYQEDNFGGDSRVIRDDIADLGWIHFDDRVSSVEVRRGVWELCQDSRYRGRCITVDHDIAKLSRLHFDDTISSVRRIR